MTSLASFSSFARIAPLLLFLISCLTARAEEWALTFAVTENKIIQSPKGDTPPRHENRSYTQKILVGPARLTVEDDRRKIVYDFARRSMLAIDPAPNTYNEWSLYGLPSFFEHELSNRNAIGAAFHAAKIQQAAVSFLRYDNETALRVESRPAPHNLPAPIIETVKLEGVIEFRHEDATVVRFVPADKPLPADLHHRFVNYLAYSCSIHPQIRQALAETKMIPQELTFTSRNAGTTTTTALQLISSMSVSADHVVLPAGAKPAEHTNELFFEILAAIESTARNPARPSPADTITLANQAVARDQPLDGMLALLEFGLQSGEQLTVEMRRHRKTFDRDPACQTYIKAYRQTDKETAEKSLIINASINRQGLTKAHMLDLQRANLLERTGHPREAIEHYFTVLRANPYHAGALHDLGMLYLRSYDHSKAWLCWDAARRLYPNHPMMSDVIRIEQEVLKNQPDFF